MRSTIASFGTVFLLLGIQGCVEEIQVPVRDESPKLVVEGMITNDSGPCRVRLTYSGRFLSSGSLPENLSVEGAGVVLNDDAGNQTTLVPVSPGYYETTGRAFVGQVGRSYVLTVQLPGGKKYVSKPERMPSVPPIDSVYAKFVTLNNPGRNYAYDIFINTRDAAQTRDYYRWTAYSYHPHRSTGKPCSMGADYPRCFISCWYPTYSRDINILSDAAVNGQAIRNRFVLRSPAIDFGNHLVEVSQYSLSREVFQFWQLYQEQATRTGSIFDPLPASIKGNIVNPDDPDDIALGFFAASAVARRRVEVSAKEMFEPNIRFYLDNLRTLPQGDCRGAFPGGTLERPSGW